MTEQHLRVASQSNTLHIFPRLSLHEFPLPSELILQVSHKQPRPVTQNISLRKKKKKNLSAGGNVTSWSHGTLGEQDAQTNCCSRRDELLANCPPRNSPLVSRLSSGFFFPSLLYEQVLVITCNGLRRGYTMCQPPPAIKKRRRKLWHIAFKVLVCASSPTGPFQCPSTNFQRSECWLLAASHCFSLKAGSDRLACFVLSSSLQGGSVVFLFFILSLFPGCKIHPRLSIFARQRGTVLIYK